MIVRGSSASRTVETLEPTRTEDADQPVGVDDELADREPGAASEPMSTVRSVPVVSPTAITRARRRA